jgi:hypothetical protein
MSKFLDCTFSELTHAFCKHHQKDLKWWKNIHGVEKHEAGWD